MKTPAPPRVLDAHFVAGATHFDQLPPPTQLEIAFAGRSNVGKSSLMNALLERRRLVRTSSTPGCTRQISLFDVTARDGLRMTWADLPGYGYAKRSKREQDQWAALIDSYLLSRPTLAVVLALVDVRRGVQADDRALWRLMAAPARVSRGPVPVLWVATKVDQVPASKRKLTLDRLRHECPGDWSGFSTELVDTHAPLWNRILRSLGAPERPPDEG